VQVTVKAPVATHDKGDKGCDRKGLDSAARSAQWNLLSIARASG
jgi:hypothetical protein